MENDPFDNWKIQTRRGIIELCILNSLEASEQYGYDLVKKLVSIADLGVTEGTVYPLLSRLRVQELVKTRLVESSSGPARKYYALTSKGRKAVQMMNTYLDSLVERSHRLRSTGEKKQ